MVTLTIPSGTLGIALLVALALPGVVFAAVRSFLRGPGFQGKDVAGRLSQAVTISVVLDAVYLLVLGPTLWSGLTFTGSDPIEVGISDPAGVAIRILVFAVAVPAILALLRYLIPWGEWKWLDRRLLSVGLLATHDDTPSAWDYLANKQSGCYVRIWRPQGDGGRWLGGWYAGRSFLGGFPSDKRDLFLQIQYTLDGDGTFLRATEDSAGLWVSINDDDIVEWLKTK